MELMISVVIGTLILAATGSLSMFTARGFTAMSNYADLDGASRNALDRISREIRQTRGLTSFSATNLTFQDWDTAVLSYTYDSNARTLTRTKSGTSKVLLQQCDYLSFDIFQRNPSNNFTFYPATNGSVAKLIDLSWKCSRRLLVSKINTETVQTDKIVIRN